MRRYRTPLCSAIALGSLLLTFQTAFGQPGTGREPTSPQKKSTTTKKAPTRTTQKAQPLKPHETALPIEMVLIPAGTFTMGSPDYEVGRSENEGPRHQVRVESFYMGKYEVTQAQYQAVMGVHPATFKGHTLPVERVTWNNAVAFCRRLSNMTGKQYRLPSEAEWEYACRARPVEAGSRPRLAPRTETPFAFGSSLASEQANFDAPDPYGGVAKGVYRGKTMPVGSFQPNAFGLYDMHGNVWEWCEDWYHDNYNGAPTDGSAWLSGGEQESRVLRGGSWGYYAAFLRSAFRGRLTPHVRSSTYGFRVVAVR